MTIFNVLSLIGGLALFLYGMNAMGDGLEKRAGGSLQRILERLTANPVKGVLLGTIVTMVIQSSSATTVMVVGFVNSGLMTLQNSVGVIMGANIGTAVTAWILSLNAIEGDLLILQLLKPKNFSPIFAAIGICMTMFSKRDRTKTTGTIFLGFAVLMYGMTVMSDAVKPLENDPTFGALLTRFENPILGVLAGTIVTAIIQSSSASVGILQALSMTVSISFPAAVPIIMGQNIGTCITALISSAGSGANGKRAALIHLYFNIIGVIIFLSLFYLVDALVGGLPLPERVNPVSIAVVHTVFKILNTIAFLPFSKTLVRLACASVKDSDDAAEFKSLDENFLITPAVAVEQCRKVTKNMARASSDALMRALGMAKTGYTQDGVDYVAALEDKADRYEDKLGEYLIKVSTKPLLVDESHTVSKLLQMIGDFERLSDHALNLAESTEELYTKKLQFSPGAQAEMRTMFDAVTEIVNATTSAFINDDAALAATVEPLEQVIDGLRDEIKANHIERLKRGGCTIEMGFILSDIITDLERISDHCSNIAFCVIELADRTLSTLDGHEYLHNVKSGENEDFERMYAQYKEKYALAPVSE